MQLKIWKINMEVKYIWCKSSFTNMYIHSIWLLLKMEFFGRKFNTFVYKTVNNRLQPVLGFPIRIQLFVENHSNKSIIGINHWIRHYFLDLFWNKVISFLGKWWNPITHVNGYFLYDELFEIYHNFIIFKQELNLRERSKHVYM